MQNFLRLATSIDVMPLVAAYRRRPELWKEDTYLRDYPQGPFEDMETIMLRFPVKRVFEQEAELEAYSRGEGKFDIHENVDYPPYKLLTEARPLVMGLMTMVHGERLGRVFINKIKPGGRIYPHADTPIHANYWTRHHIVLESKPPVVFRCEQETVYMAPGELWWFNNALEHEVLNESDIDRVHMVVDIRTAR